MKTTPNQPTRFDEVTAALATILADASAEQMLALDKAMDNYRTCCQPTLARLNATPAFRKMWDTMADATVEASMESARLAGLLKAGAAARTGLTYTDEHNRIVPEAKGGAQ